VLYRKADIMRLRPSVRMDPHSPALVDALLSAELFGVAPATCCSWEFSRIFRAELQPK